MTEKEAYGNRDYSARVNTPYMIGDKVTIGPAYRGNGNYLPDGCEGAYTVVKDLGSYDFKVCRGNLVSDWDLIVYASRLTRREN